MSDYDKRECEQISQEVNRLEWLTGSWTLPACVEMLVNMIEHLEANHRDVWNECFDAGLEEWKRRRTPQASEVPQ